MKPSGLGPTHDSIRDAFANAQLTISGPRLNENGTEKPNVTAAVVGVRGGIGASTIASSLAWLMGDKGGRSTALLDLDVHFGTGALGLDLEPGRGLTDAIENPSRIDGLFIERAMVRANDKLCVLSAEAPLNQSVLTDGSAFFQLQEEIRHAFEGTVIDLPRTMMIQFPHLVGDVNVFGGSDDLLLMHLVRDQKLGRKKLERLRQLLDAHLEKGSDR